MLIAHLPAGYILASAARQRSAPPRIMTAALVGSVLPDFDIVYFFLTGGKVHHHDYVSHWPLFWLALAVVALPAVGRLASRWFPAAVVFFAAAMLHMIMDTVAAPILWLAPFDWSKFELTTVPATYSNWVVSFMLHWTFALELLICVTALIVAVSRNRRVGGRQQA
ncbi:metal-dependent hydrolase [Rhizobium leguminosarum]|uniref:metal-dependent hydrolase n=1 Tax=Rhizobium leguminosarum TaxID=384 RepID=UPI0010310A2E|nr:metal-dependent hydrolase [Rhizobium leguminosarum]TAU87925.1 metal-dependent hydrolase [Rhizobium leguminosarum]TAV52455.1 metal-dependent hydrolase [Rhizobium leguminosarum]